MPDMSQYEAPFSGYKKNGYVNNMYSDMKQKGVAKPPGKKAFMLTFYRNGDHFSPGLKISVQPGKDFVSMDNLYDFLTQKTKIPRGVRYIYTLDGKRITSLNDFKDRESYVVSGTKQFQEMAYGAYERARTSHTARRPLAAPLREEDMKLFRPVSPPIHKRNRSFRNNGSRSHSLPASNEGKIITVVNSKDQNVHSRVLLNLRATQTFEEILRDLGQAVRVKDAKKMYSQKGQEVRSFSQLKEELKNSEKFYLDTEEDRSHSGQTFGGSRTIKSEKFRSTSDHPKSAFGGSVPNLSNSSNIIVDSRRSLRDPNRVKTGQKRQERSAKQQKNNNRPNKRHELEWVHGYNCHHRGRSLFALLTGELLYTVAAVAILYHKDRHRQRHYLGHSEDIQCMAIHPLGDIIATGQGTGSSEKSQAHIRIWRVDNLVTLSVVGLNRFEMNLLSVSFSPEGDILLAVEDQHLSLWEWSQDTEIGRAFTEQTDILGSSFLSTQQEMAVTFGIRHLTLWRRGADGVIERQDVITLMSGSRSKSILSLETLPDGNFITGDSDGLLAVWAHADDDAETYFIIKEVKAHSNGVNCILLLPKGLLVTGSRIGKEGEIRVWSLNDKYSRLISARLPPETGEVKMLCTQASEAHHGAYYIGTSYNVILEGNVQGMFTALIHGHQSEINALAADQYDAEYVTAGSDKLICKWDKDSLLWKVLNTAKCTSLCIHPESTVVAVGEVSGNIVILNLENGDQVTRFSVANTSLNTISFSPDGSILAAGGEDGNVYLYVTQNDGCKYSKGGVMKGFHPVLILDWSENGQCIQTVVSNNEYHELAVWNLKTMHKMSDMSEAELSDWKEVTCTLGQNVFGIWTNQYLKNAINVSCHRSHSRDLLATGDRAGFVRLFQYPCTNPKATYFEQNHGTSEVTSVRFLSEDKYLISVGGDGIMVWRLETAYF